MSPRAGSLPPRWQPLATTLQFEAGALFGSAYTQHGRRVTLHVAASFS